MNKKTLEALKGSIEKWDNIVKSPKALDEGITNCPLCKVFHFVSTGTLGCGECPVKKKVGTSTCTNTPYINWGEYWTAWSLGLIGTKHRKPYCRKGIKLAKAERDFLVSLLPTKEKWIYEQNMR